MPKQKKTFFRKIINFFLGILGVILFLLLVLLGFSQTSTFREMLRDEIVSTVNEKINGTFNIEKIDGSIFTSIIIRNTNLLVENDTLFSAEKVDVKISPLQILLRKIYLREIKLEHINISILGNSDGNWNISNLMKKAETEPQQTDIDSSESSEFPFTIQVNNFELNNINFRVQSFKHRNSRKSYPILNMNDFRINEFNFSAQIAANLQNSIYQLVLNNLSGKTNVEKFNIHNFTGIFEFTPRYADIQKMKLVTDRTDIELGMRLDNANLFRGVTLEDFKKYPMRISLNAEPFNFDDLSVFINGTRLLNGNPELQLEAEGNFGDFNIHKLVVDHESTHFEIIGSVKNLHIPKELFLDIAIVNSSADYASAVSLLPDSRLPDFKNVLIKKFNAKFKGKPTVFHASVSTDISSGHLQTETFLDVESPVLRYDVEFKTKNLDLTPITGAKTILTSNGSIRGMGTHPDELDAQLDISVQNSRYEDFLMDNLSLEAYARYSVVEFDLGGRINNSNTKFDGVIDFSQADVPVYQITGKLDSLNLGNVLNDSTLYTNLNFNFSADGQDLDVDDMTGEFKFEMAPSYYRDEYIDTAGITLLLEKENDHRSIKLSSDFVDLKLDGDFSLQRAFELLSYESSTLAGIISKKFEGFNPLAALDSTDDIEYTLVLPDIIDSVITIDYDFEFKDFQLIAIIMGDDKLDISGSGSGKISNNSNYFSISTDLELDYLLQRKDNKLLYLSDLDLGFKFSRDNKVLSFNNLFGTISATGSKIFMGRPVNNIAADLIFNDSKLFYNLSGELSTDLNAELEGTLELSPDKQYLTINTLYADYKKQEWENSDPIGLLLTADSTHVSDFKVSSGVSEITFSGYILENGLQNFDISLSKFDGSTINKFMPSGKNKLNVDFNLKSKITGTLLQPIISTDINVNNVTVEDINFGNLICELNYKDKNFYGDIIFIDSIFTSDNPLLSIKGNIPYDISFLGSDIKLIEEDSLRIDIKSSNFNLTAFGDLLPNVRSQSGLLFADVKIDGTLENLNYFGSVSLPDSRFNLALNNLDYGLRANAIFQGRDVIIQNLTLENIAGSNYIGKLSGKGNFSIKGFTVDKYDLVIEGDLAVLSKKSKSVSPNLYGNLVIESGGKWRLTKDENRTNVEAAIRLKNTDVIFVPEQTSYSKSKRDFIYKILVDTLQLDLEELKFKRLVSAEELVKNESINGNGKEIFDYNISVNIVDDAKLTFILAQSVNQRLIVNATGKMNFESSNNQTFAQGAFVLLDDSRLEFFKSLSATGTIRFESDITNPYLNITAVYQSIYTDPKVVNATPENVAVKLVLSGSLNELNKNLIENPGNISMYVGTRNIENNIADSKYDASDAITYLILNIFKSDLTAADRVALGQTVASATTSLLGPLLTTIVNSEIGDIVNDIQLTTVGQYTRFQVSGRYQKFRYSFGGTNEVLQNIQNANIRFEFPLIFPQLFMRVERKDPYITYTPSIEDKINELGLRYRFEF